MAEDWASMFAAAADPEIWLQHPTPERCTEPLFRSFFKAALESRSAFAFVERASGEIIGSSRYNDYDPAARRIEIASTFLVKRCWGGSINAEVKRLMLAHAFGFVDTVIFMVGEANLRSQGAMEKIGGVRRPDMQSRLVDGRSIRHVVFEIRKADFEAR